MSTAARPKRKRQPTLAQQHLAARFLGWADIFNPELRKFLRETGIEYNPAMTRFLAEVYKMVIKNNQDAHRRYVEQKKVYSRSLTAVIKRSFEQVAREDETDE